MKMHKISNTWKVSLWFCGQWFDIYTIENGGEIGYFSPQQVYEAFSLDWDEALALLTAHPFYSRFIRYGCSAYGEATLLLLPRYFFDSWVSTLPLPIYDTDEEMVWAQVNQQIAIHIRCNEGNTANLAEFDMMCWEEEDSLRVAYGKPPITLEARGIFIEDEEEEDFETEDVEEDTDS